ncbi:hypothetical protein ACFE04_003933 [Oxalis oulophora]
MATSKLTPPRQFPPPPPPPAHLYYAPIPNNDHHFVLPYFHNHHSETQQGSCRIYVTTFIILIAAFVYVFWPSDPNLKITRLHLKHIHIRTFPIIAIDVSMSLTVKVRNVDVYSLDYKGVDVAIGYRGKRLGHVKSHKGHVRALGSSYVDAELDFNGVKILTDVVQLLEDLAKGTVPFDTVAVINGQLGLLFFHIPLRVRN